MRHWNLSEEGKSWHAILCGCEGALIRVLWRQSSRGRSVTVKLHKGCCLWGKNRQHDYSPLELIKSWFLKPESPGNGHIHYGFAKKAGQTMGLGSWDSLWVHQCQPQTSAGLSIFTSEPWRAWRTPGGGNTWLRRVKCLFIQTAVQCTELPDLVASATWAAAVVLCRRCLAATQLNVRKCPSSQRLWVSWSPGHLLRKWAWTEEWVLAFPFTAQSWAFCFCLDLHFGN